MATIYDVARVANVSIATVSHVLNNTRPVSAATKERVVRAIESLNYRPSSLARAMARQETETIALLVPDNTDPFFAELARAIEKYCFREGYTLLLCNSDGTITKERAYLETLINRRVDGIIYIPVGPGSDGCSLLLDHRVPTVTLGWEDERFDRVHLDHFQGGYDATHYLVELGHRRIACISGGLPGEAPALAGYQSALEEIGLQAEPELVVIVNWSQQGGWEAARRLFHLAPPPTAIFACSDILAVGALSYLANDRGIKVPESISVVGLGNTTLSAFTTPALSTVAFPIRELGERLCKMLFARLTGHGTNQTERFKMCGELLVRQSTAAPPSHRRAAVQFSWPGVDSGLQSR